MKVFVCTAYVHVPNEMQTKLYLREKNCVFASCSLEQKGYKCNNPTTRDVRVSRDVVFDEMTSLYYEVTDNSGIDVNETKVLGNTSQKCFTEAGHVLAFIYICGIGSDTAFMTDSRHESWGDKSAID